ncbi:hypothetical protein [Streptomyces sp. ODS28]|uniref:hypothetical protein n=1 Tax=Streptomyces sp. ODS28 TaxID=3136688 RepID=UPI0031EE8F5F
MDQGTAAVLGAGVGVIGTIGSAYLGYAAARWQVRDQGRVDHGSKLREERINAYGAFLNAAQSIDDDLQEVYRQVIDFVRGEGPAPDWAAQQSRLDEIMSALEDLKRLNTRVAMAGPKAVVKAGQLVSGSLVARIMSLRILCDETTVPRHWERDHDRFGMRAYERRAQFTDEVRSVLETPPL